MGGFLEIVFISLTGIIAILSLLFGIRVYLADRYNIVNKSFGLFTGVTAIWIVLDFLAYQTNLADYQLLINRILFGVICLMILILAWFVDVFPRPLFVLPVFFKYFAVLVAFIVGLLSFFSSGVLKDVTIESWGSNLVLGDYFFIFVIYASLYAIYPLVILIIKTIKFRGAERNQIKYILYGIASLAVLNLLFNMFIPLLTKNFEFGRFGTYSAIFFVAFTAYAILKTQLFNLRVILTETAVVIIDVILTVQIFTSHTAIEALLRTLFAVFVFYGSYILVQSVKREIQQREELQKLSQDLAHANEHLKELDRMKTEFVSLASHELLTPVSAIEGYLSMTLDEKMAKIDDPKAVKYMDRVYTSAKRLARLVTDMLNVSRIEEGRLLVEKKEIDLSKLINETIEEIKFKADEKKQKIVFQDNQINRESDNPKENQSSDHPIIKSSTLREFMTFGDPDKIKEIVVNLLGNSIKYSKNPGTITIKIEKVPTTKVSEKWQKIEEEIKARPLDDQEAIKSAIDPHLRDLVGAEQLLISVKDQGIGIPKEELPRLFKKFHRVGDYTTAESQGTGLGLYISRALVELHHGRIWADSEGPSHGSTFTFSLPQLSSKQEIIDLEAQVPQPKEQLKPLARPTKEAEEI